MSLFSYIAFPRKFDTSRIKRKIDEEPRKSWMDADSNEFLKACHGITIFHGYEATFRDVFTNQFIYCFDGAFELHDEEFTYNYKKSGMDMVVFNDYEENVGICRKQLYDIVLLITRPNESVEIYTEEEDNSKGFNFGPPKNEIKINMEQILTSKLLAVRNRAKIVIKRIL